MVVTADSVSLTWMEYCMVSNRATVHALVLGTCLTMPFAERSSGALPRALLSSSEVKI